MTDTTNPRARLDAALEERLRIAVMNAASLAMAATASCEEVLSLLVDAQLAAVKPKPEPEPAPREDLQDETPVGHGWVTVKGWSGEDVLKPRCRGRFTRWLDQAGEWGAPGAWRESQLSEVRPATVGDLRRVGVPTSEWPDITAPELPPEPPLDESVVLVKGDAYQRHNYGDWFGVLDEHSPRTWAELCRLGTPTVIYTPKETP